MADRLLNRIKDYRTERGLTQAELAELVGVTRKTVNTVENGIFTPSALLAIKLARALGVSQSYVARLEAGARTSPSLRLWRRLQALAGEGEGRATA